MLKTFLKSIINEFTLLIGLAILGGLILMRPGWHHVGYSVSFIDAIFTTTSALTVTGLSVLPTGSAFSLAGKSLILLLIQIGGLGIVVIGSLFEIALLKRTPEGIDYSSTQELASDWHRVPNILFFSIKFIFVTQFLGFLSLWLLAGFTKFDALFHSISAFNNAGFSTFDNNLVDFQANPWVLVPIALLIFLGSVGFLTIAGLYHRIIGVDKKLSLYSKLLLQISLALYLVATGVIFLDLIEHSVSYSEALWDAAFLSVSLRTAGFNTFDIGHLGILGVFISIFMMVIGGGSISTAGGIKTSTAYVFLKNTFAHLKGTDVTLVRKNTRYIPKILVETSYFIVITYICVFLFSLFMLAIVEDTSALGLTDLAFESVSALSTVGLSTGITASLNDYGKAIIIFDMIVGRLGVYLFIKQLFTHISEIGKGDGNDTNEIDISQLKELEIAVG